MISLLIPCFNESEVLELTYDAIVCEAKSWNEPIEILFVDDGSRDDTWDIIHSLARRQWDPILANVQSISACGSIMPLFTGPTAPS